MDPAFARAFEQSVLSGLEESPRASPTQIAERLLTASTARPGGERPVLSTWTTIGPLDAIERFVAWCGPRSSQYVHADTAAAALFVVRHQQVFVAVEQIFPGGYLFSMAVASTDARWQWARKHALRYSRCEPVRLRTDDFRVIGARLEPLGSVEVSRVTYRDSASGRSKSSSWRRSDAITRPTPAQVCGDKAPLEWVNTMTVEVGSRLRLLLRADGAATFYSGDFAAFRSTVLTVYRQRADEGRELLTDRQRSIGERARALAVRLDPLALAAPNRLRELTRTLDAEPDLGVAVFHRNPYLHAVVTDFADGSTIDVLVLSDREAQLVPGFRATPTALARVARVIEDTFGEPQIEDAPAAPGFSLESVFRSS